MAARISPPGSVNTGPSRLIPVSPIFHFSSLSRKALIYFSVTGELHAYTAASQNTFRWGTLAGLVNACWPGVVPLAGTAGTRFPSAAEKLARLTMLIVCAQCWDSLIE